MGRAVGSIDQEKRQAVFEAATAVLAELGTRASVAEIARRSGVTRQTIYNWFGDRRRLLTAVARLILSESWPAPPDATGQPLEAVLAGYAEDLLRWIHAPRNATALRALYLGGVEVSPTQFASPAELVDGVAGILRRAASTGEPARLDAREAAPLFLDLVLAGPQLRILLGAAEPGPVERIEARARLCARIFAGALSERHGDRSAGGPGASPHRRPSQPRPHERRHRNARA